MPNLADRAEDIPQLADYLIEKHNYHNSTRVSIDEQALQALVHYPFPGNVRELENILERALALCEDERITLADLQLPAIDTVNEAPAPSLEEMTRDLERERIVSALDDNRWNQSAAARTLGITLRQLRYRMDKWDLKRN